MGRAPCCDKANVKKGPWSPEEDSKLKDYIDKNGTGGNWISLPQKAGLKRCGKSCRLRWLNYLRPNIKHGEFSDEEDTTIYTLFATIGSRWSVIAAQLPGRTDNDIKNYWNTKLKKKIMAMHPFPPPPPLPPKKLPFEISHHLATSSLSLDSTTLNSFTSLCDPSSISSDLWKYTYNPACSDIEVPMMRSYYPPVRKDMTSTMLMFGNNNQQEDDHLGLHLQGLMSNDHGLLFEEKNSNSNGGQNGYFGSLDYSFDDDYNVDQVHQDDVIVKQMVMNNNFISHEGDQKKTLVDRMYYSNY